MRDLSSSKCSYHRAIEFLIIAIAVYAAAVLAFLQRMYATSGDDAARQAAYAHLYPLLIVACVFGTLSYVVYVLSKCVMLSVETSGGMKFRVAYKRSVIENITIELDQALDAVDVMNRRIFESAVPTR